MQITKLCISEARAMYSAELIYLIIFFLADFGPDAACVIRSGLLTWRAATSLGGWGCVAVSGQTRAYRSPVVGAPRSSI